MKKPFVLMSAVAVLACAGGAQKRATALGAKPRPNLLLIVTDDESWFEHDIYGHSNLRTPHFNRLAEEGVLFRNAYVSAPSCAPSRAAILTGRNFWELDRHDVPANFAAFLNEREGDKPFFFWAGISEPHGRWPDGKEARRRLKEEFGIDADKINAEPGNNPNIKPPGFYYEILDADRQTGRMLAELERRRLLADTVVVYIGDNGSTNQPAVGFRGKGSPYDGGSHVPMALMWKGTVPPSRVIDDFVKSIDIAPTFLQAAGVPVPDGMTGNSFLDMILSGKSGWIDPKRDHVMHGNEWHTDPKTARTIRDKRYEYIVKYPNSERPGMVEELYDLQNDIWEQNSLIEDPKYAETAQRLKAKMHAYGRETADPRSTGNLGLFNETLKVQAALWPQYRKGIEFRRRVAGRPYSEMREYLGVD